MRNRSTHLLGVAVLVLACLVTVFRPIGLKPQPQNFDLHYPIQAAAEELIKVPGKTGEKKSAQDVADEALDKIDEALPQVKTNEIVVAAKARHRADARALAQRVTAELRNAFNGIETPTGYAEKLPEKPLNVIGPLAIFRPTMNLTYGLDLQGGSHLVLQLRHTVFVYKFDQVVGKTQSERDKFAADIRTELASELPNAEVEVPSREEKWDQVLLRTQATRKADFEKEKVALDRFFKAKGGTRMVDQFAEVTKDAQRQSVDIVRNRVDSLGVGEVQILESGDDRIVVDMPGIKDPAEAQRALRETAALEFRLLPEKYTPSEEKGEPFVRFTDDQGNPVASSKVFDQAGPLSKTDVQGDRLLTGNDLMPNARASRNEAGEHTVNLQFKSRGSRLFATVTTDNVGKKLAIFLDRDCISAPNIREPITGGQVEISGGFADAKESQRLASLLNSGALPVPLDIIENRTISASLGSDAVRKSVKAGLAALVVVAVFMIVWYGLPGVLADCALAIYCVLNLALLVLIGATLTLPGIAGFILSMGMSADTNILVFERLKEEMQTDKSFRAALQAAFDRAWTAILDSHVTTLIAALVLLNFGTGSVKGFAVTLALGVLSSLFTAFTVTRVFIRAVANTGLGNRRSLWLSLPVRLRGDQRKDLLTANV